MQITFGVYLILFYVPLCVSLDPFSFLNSLALIFNLRDLGVYVRRTQDMGTLCKILLICILFFFVNGIKKSYLSRECGNLNRYHNKMHKDKLYFV